MSVRATSFRDIDLAEQRTICRDGTQLFAKHLAELTDRELDAPSLLSGWTRKHLVAHIASNAAALCRLLEWARTGIETPMYASPEARRHDIDHLAELGVSDLRNLFDGSRDHLDDQWHSLPGHAWDALIRTAQGRVVPTAETVWMRTREVWVHAVDLGNGARFTDIPEVVLASLLDDVVLLWRNRSVGGELVLEVDGAPSRSIGTDAVPRYVCGSLPEVTEWATGRASIQTLQEKGLPQPPAWL
jgi:maleylpyruvate isomerase